MRVLNLMLVGLVIGGLGAAWTQTSETPKMQQPATKIVRTVETPYFEQEHKVEVWTRLGKSRTIETRTVSARDTQGRTRSSTSNLNTGVTITRVDDPVRAVRMLWSSADRVVEVLPNAVAVQGRKSCWRVEQDPQRVLSTVEAQLGGGGDCEPADHPAWYSASGVCAAPHAVKGPVQFRVHTVQPAPTQADCERLLGAAADRPAQDLGDRVIAGWPAHGCRFDHALAFAKYMPTEEIWIAAFPPDIKFRTLSRREFGLSDEGSSVGTTTELEVLREGEPDESLFEPPADYVQETISYSEVTCGPGPVKKLEGPMR